MIGQRLQTAQNGGYIMKAATRHADATSVHETVLTLVR